MSKEDDKIKKQTCMERWLLKAKKPHHDKMIMQADSSELDANMNHDFKNILVNDDTIEKSCQLPVNKTLSTYTSGYQLTHGITSLKNNLRNESENHLRAGIVQVSEKKLKPVAKSVNCSKIEIKSNLISDNNAEFVLTKQNLEVKQLIDTDAHVNMIQDNFETSQDSKYSDEEKLNAVQNNLYTISKNVNSNQGNSRRSNEDEHMNQVKITAQNSIVNTNQNNVNASWTANDKSLKMPNHTQGNVSRSQGVLRGKESTWYSPDSSSQYGHDIDSTRMGSNNNKNEVNFAEISASKSVIKNKNKREIHDKYQNKEFQRYYELNVDNFTDENPLSSYDQVKEYLYSAWKYADGQKSAEIKSIEARDNNLVKGVGEVFETKSKKVQHKKKNKDEITMFIQKDPTKKKIGSSTYLECDEKLSDKTSKIEDKLFNKSILAENIVMGNEASKVEIVTDPSINIVDDAILKNENKTESALVEYKAENSDTLNDQLEYFMKRLKQPKENLFKGLAKEKVCEICEIPDNLVKCKGPCCGLFHVKCSKAKENGKNNNNVKKQRRPRKKVGRPKKPKDAQRRDSFVESCISYSSEYQSNNVTVSLEDFELKAGQLTKEILKETEPNYDSESFGNEIDWFNLTPGKCEIINVEVKEKQDNENFICSNCIKYQKPLCFVCKTLLCAKSNNECLQKCSVMHCNKYYHLECLDVWPQTQFSSSKKSTGQLEALICPRHVCHTCVSDDPRGCRTRFSGDKLARCIRCPAVYHTFNQCVPAGTKILSASQVICPRHYDKTTRVSQHMNTSWCFICAAGGSLICCDTCPTSFHAKCLNITPPEGGFICEDCETGRLPLYEEIVWVKLGTYRWWPGIVVHPSEIPKNIWSMTHFMGEFVVRFFPLHDHYWVHRGRVFLYQEGDKGSVSSRRTTVDATFTKAVAQAKKAYRIIRELKKTTSIEPQLAQSLLPPHYVKLKTNKPVGSVISATKAILEQEDATSSQCDCRKDDPSPCGMDTNCLNRILLTECGPTCVTGDLCNNRAFEKRLYPKLVPYRTSWGGWGLKTLEDIRRGQFVIEYVGELIDEVEFKRRMKRKHETRDENYYFLTLDKDRMIDAGPKGNVARFMNNSCDPNCETQKWTVLGDVRVGLFAIKHIPANSEVTFNYNLECASVEKQRCLCGAECCSGFIGAKPKQLKVLPKKEKRAYIKKIPGKPRGRKPKTAVPPKPRELTEIEKDLLIIQNATRGLHDSDDDSSQNGGGVSQNDEVDGALTSQSGSMITQNSSLLSEVSTPPKGTKRKRFQFSPDSDGLLQKETDKISKLSLESCVIKKRRQTKEKL